MNARVGRLLPLQAATAAYNMAVDQTVLETVDQGGPMTLRLYRWSEPSLSLGYFQRLDDRAQHNESQGLDCVRRTTGGGAIVHDHELTYCLVVPTTDRRSEVSQQVYQSAHAAMVQTLSEFGVRADPFRLLRDTAAVQSTRASDDNFLCFQRRTDEDLIVAGYKVLGSAQRRSRRALLQHGSLLIEASPNAPQLPGVNNLSAKSIAISQLVDLLISRLATCLGIERWRLDELTEKELKRVEQCRRERFAHSRWHRRR